MKTFYLPQGHDGPHGGCLEGVPRGVHQEVHEPYFLPCDTTFQSSFLIEIEWKTNSGTLGTHCKPYGSRGGVPGRVYKVVKYETFFWSLYSSFLPSFWIEID